MWKNTLTGQNTSQLPKNHTDGTNLYSLSVEELKALGWEETPLPEYNKLTHYLNSNLEPTAYSGGELSARAEALKISRKLEIENTRTGLMLHGFPYLEKIFACDREAKVNMMIQYQAFQIDGTFPEDFGWKAVGEDELTPMTEAQFKELIKQAGLYCSQIYTTSFNLKKQVDELTSIDDVTNFSINFG